MAPPAFEAAPRQPILAEPLAAPVSASRPAPVPDRRPELFQRTITVDEEISSTWRKPAPIAAVAVVVGIVAYGANYMLSKPAPAAAPTARPATAAAPPAPPAAAPRRTGNLQVKSSPPGARVVIDGKPRGNTPMTVEALSPGRHTVDIQGAGGTISRTVIVTAGQTASVDEEIYAGWVTVFAPFDITVSEQGKALNADERNQIMLGPGPHELHVSNAGLAFDSVQKVDVKPGQVATVYVTPPQSSMTVTSTDAAEVWIDGTRAGAAPLFSFPINLGTHEVIVRRTAGGERRLSVTVTTKPQAVNVDFSKPGI